MNDKSTHNPESKLGTSTQTPAETAAAGTPGATLKLKPVGPGGMVCEDGVCRWEGPDPAPPEAS